MGTGGGIVGNPANAHLGFLPSSLVVPAEEAEEGVPAHLGVAPFIRVTEKTFGLRISMTSGTKIEG